MKLREFLKYDDIVVQCHNNPDADAIASGYGVYTYLKNKGKDVRFIYSGFESIHKANLSLMTESLEIPIEYVESLEDEPSLLVTVDCQYGEGNVTRFNAKKVAVIDHHQPADDIPDMAEIRSNLGSCSTVVWNMLRKEGVDVNDDKKLATALYYGLLMDTNNFTELSHPLDKDLRDEANVEQSLVLRFRNTNLSLKELVIAGKALIDYQYNKEHRFAVVQAEPCDPNILGMISDLILEVDVVDTCLVYSILPSGIKLSVRSCIKEVKASDMVQVVTNGIGSGGGHLVKAGGFIRKDKLKCDEDKISEFLIERLIDYFENTDIIYAGDYVHDVSGMLTYRKQPLKVGYARITDLFPAGTTVNIRTLEGDLDVTIEDDMYLMIGAYGEVYPIRKEKFERSYSISDEPYVFTGEYEPTVRESVEGRAVSIVPYAKTCISTGIVDIFAAPLQKRTKIFTLWDTEKYMLGEVGDYIAVRKDDIHDVYMIQGDIFNDIYKPI